MHFCKAMIALGEDIRNVVSRDEYSPVSWPEIEIIRSTHGDGAVTRVIPFVAVPQSSKAERQRLAMIYGDKACSDVWGGRVGPSEMEAPEATLKSGVTWINPISGETEITGGDMVRVPEEPESIPFDEDVKVATKKR